MCGGSSYESSVLARLTRKVIQKKFARIGVLSAAGNIAGGKGADFFEV